MLKTTKRKTPKLHRLEKQSYRRRLGKYRTLSVPGEPDSGEVAPTKLALHDVPAVLKGVADPHGVIASAAVVLRPLILGCVIAALAAQFLVLFLLHRAHRSNRPKAPEWSPPFSVGRNRVLR